MRFLFCFLFYFIWGSSQSDQWREATLIACGHIRASQQQRRERDTEREGGEGEKVSHLLVYSNFKCLRLWKCAVPHRCAALISNPGRVIIVRRHERSALHHCYEQWSNKQATASLSLFVRLHLNTLMRLQHIFNQVFILFASCRHCCPGAARGSPGFVIWPPSNRLKGHRGGFLYLVMLFTVWRCCCWSTRTEPGIHYSPHIWHDDCNMASCCTSQACHSTNLHLWLHACFIYIQLYIAAAAASHIESTSVCFRRVYYLIIVDKRHLESL